MAAITISMRSLILKICAITLLSFGVFCGTQAFSAQCPIGKSSMVLDKGEISYLHVGSGKPIVLLHGLFAQKEQWSDLACQLSLNGYAVYAPDLPGYGQSKGFLIDDYRLSRQADLIFQFTNKLALKKFDLAGNSMGGAIAALLASQHPNEVETLGFIGAPMGVVGWSPQIRTAIYQGVNPFIPIDVEQFNLEMGLLFANPPVIDGAIKEAAIKEYVSNNRHYQQVWDIVNLDGAVINLLPTSDKPSFIVWGREDGIFSISGLPLLSKKYPRSRSMPISNASHLIMLEKPQEIAALYTAFLNQKK